MNHFWSDHVADLEPYVPGEQSRDETIIKLNSNESPYAPAPEVIEAIQKAAQANLQKYPQPESDDLRVVVADYYDIKTDQVFVGNGSDEVLAHLFKALFQHPNKKILFPDITYSFYPVYARAFGIDYETIPLKDDFSIDIQDYIDQRPEEVSAIIFPNPNAPTGIPLSTQQIEELLKAQPNILVAVDEAYVDFGAESMIPLIDKYPNLFVLQTVSKSRSLAGLRVGFGFAQAQLLQALIRVKNSFNSYPIDRLAQAGTIASFKAEQYFTEKCKTLIDSREKLKENLSLIGFEVLPSSANFLFVRHSKWTAKELHERLKQNKIYVRHFEKPRCDNYLRISIGLPSECDFLLTKLKEIIHAS